MAITVKHKFVSAIPDGADTSIVRPSNWNDEHDLVGTVPVANGGTGASTANGAITNLLPNQTGNSGKFLSTDGTNTLWSSPSGSGDVVGPASATDNAIARFDTTTGKLIQNSIVTVSDTGAVSGVINETFTPVTAPAYAEGRVFYDTDAKTLCYYNDNNQMTVNIGQENIVRVRNQTGATLTNGTVVYINGATGNTPTVTKAIATSFATADIIGVLTTDIANNGFGYATTTGLVNGLDTSAFSEGDAVFLSATTAGTFTTTEPARPNYSIQVGVILRANPSVGTLLVAIQIISTENIHIVGTLAVDQGGTGQTSYTNGQLLIGNTTGNTLTKSTLTAGTAIGITNGAGSVTITNAGVTGLTAGTGISLSGSTGNVTVTNSAPDQTVVLTAGSNVTITGTYPNFTIAASGGGGSAATPTTLGTVYGTVAIAQERVGLGYNALLSLTTGNGNVAVGYAAGESITGGGQNIAIGGSALRNIVGSNDSIGIGQAALGSVSSNSNSIGIGTNALREASGNNNTAIGYQAGYTGFNNITTGTNNILIGYNAAASASTVSNEFTHGNSSITSNRFWGDFKMAGANAGTSGQVLISGGAGVSPSWGAAPAGSAATPTALGTVYGATTTSTLANAALGYEANNSLTTGTNNVALGYRANKLATTAEYNIAIGTDAVSSATTSSYHIGIGWKALKSINGGFGIALGHGAMEFATSGNANIAIGNTAMAGVVTGNQNTGIGQQCFASLTSGSNNIAIGADAVKQVTTASNNIGIGEFAIGAATGSGNTAVGHNAGRTGTNNLTTGTNNILIGANAQASSSTVSNENTFGNSSSTSNRFWGDFKMNGSGAGTSGQVLTSAGAGVSPTWTTPSGGGASNITVDGKTAAYTVVIGDLGKVINCTANTFTVSLTAAATLGAGFNVTIWNTGTGDITIDPAGSETIDSRSTLVLRNGEGTQIICNGTNWNTGSKKTMRGYSENINGTQGRPTATGGNAIAIASSSVASNTAALAVGVASNASGTNSAAIGSNSTASGASSVALGSFSIASGSSSVAAGASATASGISSIALGESRASGTGSFAAAITSSSISYGSAGAGSVAIGPFAYAENQQAIAMGYFAYAQNPWAVSIGKQNQALGTGSVALGQGSSAYSQGKFAFSSSYTDVYGDAQRGLLVLKCRTTDATPTVLNSDGAGSSFSSNQLFLNDASAFAFTGTVVARRQSAGGTESAAWKVEGLIRRETGVGTTTLVASTVTDISNAPSWVLALSADTTRGCLQLTFTGAASTNIAVVATIDSSEVIYA